MKIRAAAILALVLPIAGLVPVPAMSQAVEAVEPAVTPGAGEGRLVNGARFGAWVLACEAVAVNETACVLSQRLARSSDGAYLADLLLFWGQGAEQPYLAARVPNGVYFPAGFVMRNEETDDAEQTPFVWQSCSPELCEALVELSFEEVAAHEEGGAMIAGYRPSIVSDAVVFRFSMEGAEAGLNALRASIRR